MPDLFAPPTAAELAAALATTDAPETAVDHAGLLSAPPSQEEIRAAVEGQSADDANTRRLRMRALDATAPRGDVPGPVARGIYGAAGHFAGLHELGNRVLGMGFLDENADAWARDREALASAAGDGVAAAIGSALPSIPEAIAASPLRGVALLDALAGRLATSPAGREAVKEGLGVMLRNTAVEAPQQAVQAMDEVKQGTGLTDAIARATLRTAASAAIAGRLGATGAEALAEAADAGRRGASIVGRTARGFVEETPEEGMQSVAGNVIDATGGAPAFAGMSPADVVSSIIEQAGLESALGGGTGAGVGGAGAAAGAAGSARERARSTGLAQRLAALAAMDPSQAQVQAPIAPPALQEQAAPAPVEPAAQDPAADQPQPEQPAAGIDDRAERLRVAAARLPVLRGYVQTPGPVEFTGGEQGGDAAVAHFAFAGDGAPEAIEPMRQALADVPAGEQTTYRRNVRLVAMRLRENGAAADGTFPLDRLLAVQDRLLRPMSRNEAQRLADEIGAPAAPRAAAPAAPRAPQAAGEIRTQPAGRPQGESYRQERPDFGPLAAPQPIAQEAAHAPAPVPLRPVAPAADPRSAPAGAPPAPPQAPLAAPAEQPAQPGAGAAPTPAGVNPAAAQAASYSAAPAALTAPQAPTTKGVRSGQEDQGQGQAAPLLTSAPAAAPAPAGQPAAGVPFQPGQRVRWAQGRKAGTEATVVAVRPDGRLHLRLDDGKEVGKTDGITPTILEAIDPATAAPATAQASSPSAPAQSPAQPTQSQAPDQVAAEARRRFEEKRKARNAQKVEQPSGPQVSQAAAHIVSDLATTPRVVDAVRNTPAAASATIQQRIREAVASEVGKIAKSDPVMARAWQEAGDRWADRIEKSAIERIQGSSGGPMGSDGRPLGDISHLTITPLHQAAASQYAKAKALDEARAKLMQLGQQLKDRGSLGMPAGEQDDAAFGAVEALYRAGLGDFPAMLEQIHAFGLPFAQHPEFHSALEDAYDAFQEAGGLPARAGTTAASILAPSKPKRLSGGAYFTDENGHRIYVDDQKQNTPAPAPAPAPAGDKTARTQAAAKAIAAALNVEGGAKLDWRGLFALADQAFGGTQGSGAYTVQDAYEALQLAVNQLVVEHASTTSPTATDPKAALAWLDALENDLPTQTKRTDEQVSHQQFSTPPTYAFLANWAANVRPGEVYLEPQIGTGSLAAFGRAAGAQVYGNELSERRAKLAESLGIQVTTENADHLHAIYAKRGIPRPDVVVMNPPFSATAGRTGKRDLLTGARHIEEAFKLLNPGGRLVAIVGEGMSYNAPSYADWWKGMVKQAIVRANIPVDGRVYHKFGTDFGTRLLVLDKPLEGQPAGMTNLVMNTTRANAAPVESLEQLARMLEETRRERPAISRGEGQPAAAQPGGAGDAATAQPDAGRPQPSALPVPGPVGPGERGAASGSEPGAPAGPERPVGNGGKPGADARPAAASDAGLAGRPAGPVAEAGPAGSGAVSDRPAVGGAVADAPGRLTATSAENTGPIQEEGGSYAVYKPSVTVPGAKPHAAELVESAAMASVQAPPTTYKPSLPDAVVKEGKLSDAQLEQVIRAGQAHGELLPDGSRSGYFIGDGTGVGKGRAIAGIVLDNWRQGRRKAVWVSKNGKLAKDALRDWTDIGGPDGAMIKLPTKVDGKIEHTEGVAFLSYDTLKTRSQVTGDAEKPVYTGRLKQLVDWLGKDFDGVVAFDEAHMMGNAVEVKGKRGKTKPAQRALMGVALQKALPKARVVYVSATGATEVANLSYAERLGLWGQGTAFANTSAFISQIASSGIAAMEVVARDLKSLGRYLARSISFRGVGYDRLTHNLTEDQVQVYNRLADAWQSVLQNLDKAMEKTGAANSGQAKSAAKAQFWGTHQRFFNQVMTGMQMPSVIRQMEQDVADGKAIVVQLVNTNAAAQERALTERNAAKAGGAEDEDGADLADLDTTPREALMKYLRDSFPVAKFEERPSPTGEGTVWVLATDKETGQPIEDPDAMAIRDQLIQDLKDIRAPDGPLDQILNTFGTEQVAEVTGRQKRVVMERQEDGSFKPKLESRSDMKGVKEAQEFQDDKRKILIFSDAGGTGQSYHASLKAKNQRLRRHYVLQPGWRADAALQGLGRTHRTNQAQPPEFVLVSTNLKAQKRFISSIARRLDQLGALTKGQRQTGSGGLFSASDNLESEIAQDSLDVLMTDLRRHDEVGFSPEEFEKQTGLKLWKESADGTKTPAEITIPQFLNRLLSLKTDMQDTVFDAFDERLQKQIEQAKRDGTLDEGVEKLTADSVRVADEKVVNTEKRSGAKTSYMKLDVRNRFTPLSWEDANKAGWSDRGQAPTYVRNAKSGNVFVLHPVEARVDPSTGKYQERFKAVGITGPRIISADDAHGENMAPMDKASAEKAWAENVQNAPEFKTHQVHWITGALLPVWDRLPSELSQVFRTTTDDGRPLLGREIRPGSIDKVLESLGAGSVNGMSVADAMKALKNGQTVRMANGWRLIPVTFSGEKRIELKGRRDDHYELAPFDAEFRRVGVIKETAQFKARYFVPNTASGFAETVGKLAESRPLVRPGAGESLGMPEIGDGSYGSPDVRVPVDPLPDTGVRNRDKLILDLEQAIGRNIVVGKQSGRAGGYFPGTAKVQITHSGNLDATAHEVAHALDDQYGIVADWAGQRQRSPYDDELMPLAAFSARRSDSLKIKRAEGVAEYLRAWMVNPDEAEARAPRFHLFLMDKLPPRVRTALRDFGDQVRGFAGMSALDKTAANIREVGIHGEQESAREKMRRAIADSGKGEYKTTWRDRVRALVQDRTWGLIKAMRQAAVMNDARTIGGKPDALGAAPTGAQLNPLSDPELLLRLYGGFNDRMELMLEKGPLDTKGKPRLPGGVDWLLSWAKDDNRHAFERDMRLVQAYMVSQRVSDEASAIDSDTVDAIAMERMNNLDQQAAEKRIDEIAAEAEARKRTLSGAAAGLGSDVEVAQKALDEFNALPAADQKRIREGARRYRAWADATMKHLVDMGYIDARRYAAIRARNPNYVDMHRVFDDEETIQALKAFKGSTRQIDNPFDSLLVSTEVLYRKAQRNQVLARFRDLLTTDRGIYEGKAVNLASIGRKLDAEADDTVPIRVTRTEEDPKTGQERTVVETEYWQFAPDVRAALEAWGSVKEDGIVSRVFQLPAQLLRFGVTHSPAFVVRNVIRDAISRGVVSRTGSKPWGIFTRITPAEREAMRAAGGGQAGHYLRTKINYDRELSKRIKELTGDKSVILSAPGDLWGLWDRTVKGSETVGRMAEFRRAYSQAKARGLGDYEASLEAAYRARELLDYAVAGTLGKELSKYVPFANAAVQGLKATTSSAMANPKGFLGRWSLYVLMPTVATYLMAAMNGDDDELRQMPAWRRDLFWNIRVPGGWLAIPKPFELGAFASAAERAIDAVNGHDHAFEGYAGSLAKSMLPFESPEDLIGPMKTVIEIRANRDLFRDSDIVPYWEERLPVARRAGTAHASSIGRTLQAMTGDHLDARYADHFIRGLTGGTGSLAMDMADTLAGRNDRRGISLPSSGLFASIPTYDARDVRWALNEAVARKEDRGRPVVALREALKQAARQNGEERAETMRHAVKIAQGLRLRWEGKPYRGEAASGSK